MNLEWLHRLVLVALLASMVQAVHAQSELILTPIKDNTLYESESGALSNGAGEHLFAGLTGAGTQNSIRRALIAFDVSGIAAGAVVDSVTLTVTLTRTISGEHPLSMHRVTSDWGEGTSHASGQEGGGATPTANDATWIHTFFDTGVWQTPGGDFVGTASATIGLGSINGPKTFESTDALVADVQQWIDDPESNFGWVLLGNEDAASSAKQFDSRHNPNEARRPTLAIYYSDPTAIEDELPARSLWLGENYPEPARTSTSISLEVERPRHATIELYDVLGRRRRVLLDRMVTPGTHRIEVHTNGLQNGTYFYCLVDDAGRSCRPLILAR